MNALLAIFCAVLLAGIAIGLLLQGALYSRLRAAHPRVLRILAESGADILAFPRYLWKRRYRGLGDGAFTRRADFLRRYWQGCFLLFLLAIGALVLAVTFHA